MNSRLETIMRGMAFDEWGVCRFHDALPLLPVRSKARIPQGARSVIVVLFGYYIGDFPNRNISYYAIVDDYHTVLRAALETAAEKLCALFEGEQFVPFVDASPVAEVRAACLAGLGDIGMNGQLLNRTYASRCFIGEIVTTAALEPSRRAAPLCTRCGRCVAACPTGALRPDGFDRALCRSHITQKKGALTGWERAQIRGKPYGSEKPCACVLRASRAGCGRRQCSPPVRGEGLWLARDDGASAQFGDHLRGCAGRYGYGRSAQPARGTDVKRRGRQTAVRKVETIWRF